MWLGSANRIGAEMTEATPRPAHKSTHRTLSPLVITMFDERVEPQEEMSLDP